MFETQMTDTLCENSDQYRPGLWLASWINYDKHFLSQFQNNSDSRKQDLFDNLKKVVLFSHGFRFISNIFRNLKGT